MKYLLILKIILLSIFLNTVVVGQKKQKIIGSKWNNVLKDGSGEMIFYWVGSNPFIYEDKNNLTGIEYDIANSFKQYIENHYHITLKAKWVKATKFEGLLTYIGEGKGGVFGMSGVSITEERKAIVQFTPPYLHDICVLVSSPNVPVEHNVNGFVSSLEGLTALTIKGSTFEQKLLEIQKEQKINLKFKYIESNSVLIDKLENMENGFGYIDLPSFLIDLNKGTSVRRQYFYPLKLPGLSFVYPKDSEWSVPVEAYFNSQQFQLDKKRIINTYFGSDILELMDRMALTADHGLEEEIIMLTKERELQYEELLNQSRQREKDQRLMNLMVLIILAALLFAAIFYTRYRVKLSANLVLAEKQVEIESKNMQLKDLNDEKNHLIGVLAHDLRAPIGRIIGAAKIAMYEAKNEHLEMLKIMVNDAEKLSAMISKILDVEAIENHSHNLNIEDVDAVGVINELVNDYKLAAYDKEINVEKSFVFEKVLYKADKIYLRQALENLLSNALKFSNPGTTVRISIDDENVIHIKDQGPGFTEEDKLKVFKKFQRLSAKPTAGEKSTGLGLVTVRLFVELMKGELWFDSKESEGTVFHIKLPLCSQYSEVLK